MIKTNQMRKIKRFAIDIDWNLAFGSKAKGNRHLFRIVKLAKSLAQEENCRLDIVEAGAWLHDTNLEITIAGSTLANEKKIISFLKEIRISNQDAVAIIECIESHDGRLPAKIIEAKIVHDADTLEKMGPLGILRETWKRSQLGWNTEKIAAHLKKHLETRRNKLYTNLAKRKAKELDCLSEFFKVLDLQLREK